MREASDWIEQNSSRALTRALRLAVVIFMVTLGVGLVVTSGAARAADDDDDDKSIDEKIIGGIIAGIGGTNMENRGIEYRERSPLVVPPRLDLPPPAASSDNVRATNWPKDPDEARRKRAIAERKKNSKDINETNRSLTPAELNVGRTATATRAEDSVQPGNSMTNPVLSPSQLGFNGSLSNLFGGNKAETSTFKGEPTRESLTQPPVGYQTPSPNFAYGTGPAAPPKEYNPVAGKYGD
jgi:hypothetical protein